MAVIGFGTPAVRASYKLGSWNTTFTYDVQVDNNSGNEIEVKNYYFSNINQGYFYNGAVLTEVQVESIPGAPFFFKVVALFQTVSLADQQRATLAPVDRDPVIAFSTREFPVPADFDANGNPILNSAGQPFVPAIEKRIGQTIIHVTKNYFSYDAQAANTYKFTTNAGSMFGFDVGQLLCSDITATQQTEILGDATYNYWQVTFQFESNTLYSWNWQAAVLQCGTKQLVSGKLIDCIDDEGHISKEPLILDGTGKQLPTGTTVGSDSIKKVTLYNPSDFSVWGIG